MKRMSDEEIRLARIDVGSNQHECDCGLTHEPGCFEGEAEGARRRLETDHDRARAREARLEAALREIRARAHRSDTGVASEISTMVDAALEAE